MKIPRVAIVEVTWKKGRQETEKTVRRLLPQYLQVTKTRHGRGDGGGQYGACLRAIIKWSEHCVGFYIGLR